MLNTDDFMNEAESLRDRLREDDDLTFTISEPTLQERLAYEKKHERVEASNATTEDLPDSAYGILPDGPPALVLCAYCGEMVTFSRQASFSWPACSNCGGV